MFSDHSGIQLEINKEDTKTMYQNIWDTGKEGCRRVRKGGMITEAEVGEEDLKM